MSYVPDRHKRLLATFHAREFTALVAAATALTRQRPGEGFAWLMLGAGRMALGQHEHAEDALVEATRLLPENLDTWLQLVHCRQYRGNVPGALDAFDGALARFPGHAELLLHAGRLALEHGLPGRAETYFARLVSSAPELAEGHYNLGLALCAQDRKTEAIPALSRALELARHNAEACSDIGLAFEHAGAFVEAEAASRQAIALDPGRFEAHNNLGNLLRRRHDFAGAIAAFREAVRIKPLSYIYSNLGQAQWDAEELDGAIESFSRAVELDPGNFLAHEKRGTLLLTQLRFLAGTADLKRTIELDPAVPAHRMNLGRALMNFGETEEARACFEAAQRIDPDDPEIIDHLLFLNEYRGDAAYNRNWSQRYATLVESTCAPMEWPPSRFRAMAGRPLRVGLVSGDLRTHPVGFFLESVLQECARDKLEFHAYCSSKIEDELTDRLKTLIPHWRRIDNVEDTVAADLIKADQIDILIDLSGHTGGNRLPLFAHRPAPLQLAWLGWYATTGLKAIDYILADPIVLPPEEECHFTEKPWRLPEIYYCFTPPSLPLEPAPLPAKRNGYVTFGCFNKLYKLNERVVATWAALLRALRESRLLLKAREFVDPHIQSLWQERFLRNGIDPGRLILEHHAPRAEYLAAYQRVDVALDPFPFPGGTTTAEGLWMGVPCLTMRGHRFVGHQGETLLSSAGLSAWIAEDEADYIAKAIGFAADLNALADLRASLRTQVLASPLFDARRFARHFEDALHGMWEAQTRRPA